MNRRATAVAAAAIAAVAIGAAAWAGLNSQGTPGASTIPSAVAQATPIPTPSPTPVPTLPPTPVPAVPSEYAPVPAALFVQKNGPTFPLPPSAQVFSSLASIGGGWRLTATVADVTAATAFYAGLFDPTWPRDAAVPASELAGTRFTAPSDSPYLYATVWVHARLDRSSEIVVAFATRKAAAAPSLGWLAAAIPHPSGQGPTGSPLADFPVAWRLSTLTVTAEAESNSLYYGLYHGAAADFAATVAAYEAVAAQTGGGAPSTAYNDDRSEAMITFPAGFVAIFIDNADLNVAVEVRR